jgi:hypothetical protein
VPDEKDTMIFWLGQAAQKLREEQGRMRVHIGAEAGHGDSVVWKFEKGRWPRHPEAMVEAYARDLDLEVTDIWAEGLSLWREYRTALRAQESVERVSQGSQSSRPREIAAPRSKGD